MAFFFSKWRRKNGQRATLQALMALDDRRLSDLGLSRYDLADAFKSHGKIGPMLSARRSERAAFWLR